MRRIALIADVHANVRALEAVLADIDAAGIRERYCLGDLVGYGAEPSAVVERIRALGIPTVRGNYDDGVGKRLGGCGCYYASEQAAEDGAGSYTFTDTALDESDHEWLAALPDALRLEAGGVRVLLVHGSPRRINEYLQPDRPDELLARLAREAEADVVCVGHVHVPWQREVAPGVWYVSVPSVGKPKDGDPRAGWTELLLGEAGEVDVLVHRAAYDVEAAAAAVVAAGLPTRLADALRLA